MNTMFKVGDEVEYRPQNNLYNAFEIGSIGLVTDARFRSSVSVKFGTEKAVILNNNLQLVEKSVKIENQLNRGSNMTKKELEAKVAGLELAIKSITERTGCPKGYLPMRKMVKHLGVSRGLMEFTIAQNPRMAKRVYSTKNGGQIINCTGYNISSMRKALKKVIDNCEPRGKLFMQHKSGQVFKVGG